MHAATQAAALMASSGRRQGRRLVEDDRRCFNQTMLVHAYFITCHIRLLQLSTYILYHISCLVVAIDKGLVGGPIVDLCDLTQRLPFKLKWESCR